MLTRLAGSSAAMAITMLISTGIIALIAYEFLGEAGVKTIVDLLTREVVAEEVSSERKADTSDNGFNPKKEIHFFESVPVEGTDLVISTGAAYGSVEAVQARKPERQWCYITVDSDTPGISGRVDLGSQHGDEAPIYADLGVLGNIGLETRGIAAQRLTSLAHTHCRFNQLIPVN